jgi:hypothetical protein
LFFAGSRALPDAAFARCLRDEAERLVKEAMARNTVAITQGNTRIETKCAKCGPAQCRMMVPGERIELPTKRFTKPAVPVDLAKKSCRLLIATLWTSATVML